MLPKGSRKFTLMFHDNNRINKQDGINPRSCTGSSYAVKPDGNFNLYVNVTMTQGGPAKLSPPEYSSQGDCLATQVYRMSGEMKGCCGKVEAMSKVTNQQSKTIQHL